ncbi:MAG: hypothetical protein KZQ66_10595 [Candidatus Thiodiazotropha sp. (ex Lucinoma aequizonata)]|nr:hypothetical protein [Candidatus Thiodiazotropha sp. (ex Lucinoma aequizonata)]MCU7888057.1 hypothetical protein [Candidatus Thiodiazotropha sp. (ex Lucinoma aequizonata)]MCU7894197.1 hypothetical protein [Candidatus Thiodiazotropha sp. (ex Lucinoma aequizonata)]MCU7898398.1 hypothetical protein [Candidatus Thiodiazotropha sp. (ex Lucinoma aequizonata)]MCU7902381.1 hypothetical protein [Candidatus Thiodiazotropha sp. (ex Lucinoma aequizonata)]
MGNCSQPDTPLLFNISNTRFSYNSPTFRSTRIYSPLSADEVRLRLIAQRGYSDIELPCTRTL